MTFFQPLDFQNNFINMLAGSLDIFIILCLAVIAMLAARFRMSNVMAVSFIALFVVMLGDFASSTGFYILAVLIGGIAVFYGLQRIFTR